MTHLRAALGDSSKSTSNFAYFTSNCSVDGANFMPQAHMSKIARVIKGLTLTFSLKLHQIAGPSLSFRHTCKFKSKMYSDAMMHVMVYLNMVKLWERNCRHSPT